ncbi:MAG: hypothetical protein JST55_14495 [Bacteroidetes bacterium]|nr:hypothetical protein [Bacteroidota bacterium]
MPSRDIFWIGQVTGDTYHPDTTLTNPYLKNINTLEQITAYHIGNGGYVAKNIPNGDYTFHKNDGTLIENILGNGLEGTRHYFDGNVIGEEIISGTINKDRLPNDIPKSKISGLAADLSNLSSSITTGLAAKAGLASNNDFTGPNTFEQIITIRQPISTDYADPDLDSAPNNLITNARLEYKIAHYQGYAESVNYARVAPGVTAQQGKVYPTIQGAVTSFASPSSINICKVLIQGMGTSATYMLPAASCMKSYVNLVAADRSVMISFQNVNCSEKVTIENATVVLGGGTTNNGSTSARIWSGVSFINCRIYHFRNFTLKGGLLENCTVISPNGITLTIDKDGSNNFTDVISSTFRVQPQITDEANYTGATDITVIPALKVIEDFTSGIES